MNLSVFIIGGAVITSFISFFGFFFACVRIKYDDSEDANGCMVAFTLLLLLCLAFWFGYWGARL